MIELQKRAGESTDAELMAWRADAERRRACYTPLARTLRTIQMRQDAYWKKCAAEQELDVLAAEFRIRDVAQRFERALAAQNDPTGR